MTRRNLIFVTILLLQGAAWATPQSPALSQTPPMGWNSWNAFETKIDDATIRGIADAMVSSGMRDAGYVYLVLDDGWMAKERDEDGRLMADPKKFPKGMKSIGDYIHSKGLKFGIYEDRGKWTCQQLPGSFEHEQIDMQTFADWGVDYIKMDSCFAESNGRFSSEDYALYHKYIAATGRPMVLSISDFGNAAWAWGGKESAQLWRTSGDIYPWMDSIYHCAETSAGDRAIHPAFNGLWQFAAPGHWNDPDMLHIGNLKHIEEARKPIGNRAHFSLWCILAAPLMAGNDLRSASQEVKQILTAPELIAVNQDARGVQGYKVFVDGKLEVYNKPLADGTTAILLLNKGREKADIRVRWDQVGLSGKQAVRDLWARKNLGSFDDGFTAKGLGQHEHRMIKVGKPGPLLPLPSPMALDKYTVTRQGETQLSDLYYIWKAHNTPAYDTSFNKQAIVIGDRKFDKGFGVRGKSAFMFLTRGRADRFRATVALDPASKAGTTGRFRVHNEDFFANKVLWDSGKMTKDSAPREIDIELKDVQCLMLVFEGKEALGNWADARVLDEPPTPLAKASQTPNKKAKVPPQGAREVRIKSSLDQSQQPAFFYAPKQAKQAVPLLVVLHTWSGDYRQRYHLGCEDWCIKHGWAYIHPNFRGPNQNPDATGSKLAVQDVLDAVAYAQQQTKVDKKRILLVGASGGGYMSLLMAGQAPELWAGVSAWVPISDLAAWHGECKARGLKYAREIELSCGGSPGKSKKVSAEYRTRSPLTYLAHAKGIVPLDINAGIRDGHDGSVPISHSLHAFNLVANTKDRVSKTLISELTKSAQVPKHLAKRHPDASYGKKHPLFRRSSGKARVTVFDGGHDFVTTAALAWLSQQTLQ